MVGSSKSKNIICGVKGCYHTIPFQGIGELEEALPSSGAEAFSLVTFIVKGVGVV